MILLLGGKASGTCEGEAVEGDLNVFLLLATRSPFRFSQCEVEIAPNNPFVRLSQKRVGAAWKAYSRREVPLFVVDMQKVAPTHSSSVGTLFELGFATGLQLLDCYTSSVGVLYCKCPHG